MHQRVGRKQTRYRIRAAYRASGLELAPAVLDLRVNVVDLPLQAVHLLRNGEWGRGPQISAHRRNGKLRGIRPNNTPRKRNKRCGTFDSKRERKPVSGITQSVKEGATLKCTSEEATRQPDSPRSRRRAR